jgi:nuclear pore complex protein Nup62
VTASLKNKTLDELINEWGSELEENVNLFTTQAIRVANWDREVMENGDRVTRIIFDIILLTTTIIDI